MGTENSNWETAVGRQGEHGLLRQKTWDPSSAPALTGCILQASHFIY